MSDRIAIVGIGGVFPGSRDLDEFWQNILNAKDTAINVTADRWRFGADELYSSGIAPDKVNSRRACLIQDFEFDPGGLDVDAELLQRLDPMYQIVLHAGRAAWNDTNTGALNKERVGIIIGNIVLPTESSSLFSDEVFKQLFEEQLFNQLQNQTISSPGNSDFCLSENGQRTGTIPQSQGKHIFGTEPLNRYVAGLPAGLLAKALGLGAGAYTLDAACASSLYSLKYAVDELLAGRCDAMLAGGLSRPDCLYTQMGFSQLNAISRSGRCSPFDSKADGLVVGEGAGIFVLKRLSDAVQQGDHIYATIEGIGLSNDIQGNIMSPDSDGQLRAMQSAYAGAGWLPNEIQHIECHGTGTPTGDSVEFNSLKQLWQSHNVTGECVIGSVKSNVGHLLTAAGAAALMKTLLAMRHGVLPPTANYESPSNKTELANSPFRVLDKAEPWPLSDAPARRAAISGFGFGGINAHVLLQEYKQEKQIKPMSMSNPVADIAIVGMDTRLGPWKNQDEFNNAVLSGADRAATQPDNCWGAEANEPEAYWIDELNIPLGRYRIPPAELKEMLPQQILMLEIVANALADAGLAELTPEQQIRTGVFIGIALDMNTSNFHFRWMQKKYAREWLQRLGIQLNENELNDWIENLRTACGPGLNANRTMGALGGIVASRIARAFRIGGPAFTLSAEETSGLAALRSGVRALQQHELDQSIIGAVDLASDLRAVKAHIAKRNLDCVADGATAFILKRHEDARRDGDQIYAVIKGIGAASVGACDELTITHDAQILSIQNACADAACHLDSIDQLYHAAGDNKVEIPALQNSQFFKLGHSGAANGLMAVASAVGALSQRVFTANNHSQTCYWLKDRLSGPRRSLVNSTGIDGNSVSVLLEEADTIIKTRANKQKLFLLAAADPAELVKRLQSLSFEDECAGQHGEHRVSILAKNTDEFNPACQEAISAIKNNKSIHNGHCFYSVEPLDGKVAFVYPGSGNHFQGMGQALGVAFPEVLEKLHNENDRLASQFAGGRFWTVDDGKAFSHEEVIFAQVCLGTFVSDVVSSFDISPDAIIGYSLGETVGFFSTRTWTARDEMFERIQKSTLFTEDLAGDCTAVQRAWGTDEPIEWALGVINTNADAVKAVLKNYPHVYLLIINTPTECVIGGDLTELNQALKELNAQYYPLSGVTTVHCEVAKPVEKTYRDLHVFKTTPPEGVTFYSGIRGGAYEVNQDTAADSILDQALEHFDYTRVINSAYEDGVRLFIEMGPGSSCSRMIDQILQEKPHYTKAVCVKGQDSVENVLQLLARLHVEGVSVDTSKLQQEQKTSEYKKFITVKTGGRPFKVPSPSKTINKVLDVVPPPGQAIQLTQSIDSKTSAALIANDGFQSVINQIQTTEQARAETQKTFLRVSQGMTNTLAEAITMQMRLLNGSDVNVKEQAAAAVGYKQIPKVDCKFDREACLEFAIGSIGKMLGSQFADIDHYPSRVRLPDEPLMLVDRILDVDGEPDSMTHGRVITEHDIRPGAWYLDLGRIPTCIAVEAGQADLFLSGYLGIDHITKGHAVYRLLDARITFHGPLPKEGQTIHYDIQIDHFFRQGDTWLFRFNFEGSVNGQALLTMTQGCAGFFTQQELDAGQGIVLTNIEKQPAAGKLTGGYRSLLDMQIEAYNDTQLDALRQADLVGCFGELFADTGLNKAVGLPGGHMSLVHRILNLDPYGGRYGIGQITGEADIHPDDWFLICHFVDDKVMPGTLMYECCLHTLRVYLLRMGWVGERDEFVYEPIVGETSQLKCRGQVIETTRTVQYEISLKEIGYKGDGVPYVLADALMYADHRAVVQMKNMSVQLTGLNKKQLEARWQSPAKPKAGKALFDNASILAFAEGNPSDAFGERYKIFDKGRRIARLPRPPYKFLDQIVSIKDCEQWVLKAGAVIEAEYEVPADEWYFTEDRQSCMPFAVLLEVALQPCGWLAAYSGSALNSETDLSFRNLGGRATQSIKVARDIGVLKTRIRISNVSQSGGMIIQDFDYEMSSAQGLVYKGDTCFGFFSKEALADQIGIREALPYSPTVAERDRGTAFAYPDRAPMPDAMLRMLDEISLYVPDGGANGLGYIEGRIKVKSDAWFFKAHFYQDPVWPGSLGLESFQQLLRIFAWKRWQDELTVGKFSFDSMALNQEHQWVYRGQILPTDDSVTVQAVITGIDDQSRMIKADGFLSVDGRIIYQMEDFALRISPL